MPRQRPDEPARRRELKQAPILYHRTQELIAGLARQLGGPLIAYWTSVGGSVCHNDVVAMNEILGGMPAGRIDTLHLFIKSDGGNGRAALRLVNLLRRRCRRLIALVPLNCESAATMLALGCDEIHMGPMAFLTAVDTSLTHDLSPVDKDNDRVRVGTNEVQRIIALWKAENGTARKNPYEDLYRYIHPLVIGAVNRAGSLSTMLCDEILSYHVGNAALRRRISRTLNNDYPSHGYPIVMREAKRIGLKVRELDPRVEVRLVQLNELYSEMAQRCRTDYDEFNHHDNEITNILESASAQIRFQIDKDWHFRQSDRTWIYTNEQSRWCMLRGAAAEARDSVLHIR